jgi:glycolate oxidase FAD binding subunit
MSTLRITSDLISSRLSDISGEANVTNDPKQLASYAIGSMSPAAAVRPGSAAEVAEIVKFAAAEKLALVPAASRTKLGMGLPPRKYDLALDMTRLNRVLAYDPGDMTLSVEPGILLADVAKLLAEHGQFVPLAAPFHDRATVGGTIASGVDGPLRQMYGTARDYVLGMEFVTGDGVIAKSGGRVVKNVAGYDLHKLMIGALGTLGILTKINFRTFPAPSNVRVFVAGFDRAAQALDMRARVAQSPLRPLTMEIVSPGATELLGSAAAARIAPDESPWNGTAASQWAFAASFAGNEKALERYARDLQGMAADLDAARAEIFRDAQALAALRRLREFIPIAMESSPAATILKLSVLPARMQEILETAARVIESNTIESSAMESHAIKSNGGDTREMRWAALARGVGVIYIVLLPEAADEEHRQRVAAIANEILQACAAAGGEGSIPWCPAPWKASLKVWGLLRSDFEHMRSVKQVFDPHGILAPGRFVGGL